MSERHLPVCDYHQYRDPDADPCTGPVAPRDCSYSAELANKGDVVKQCNCCTSCAHECYLNV